jgi:hypothetical protein
MWLFTTRGFYSVVQDKEDSRKLVVRARLHGDLEKLREIAPKLSDTFQLPRRDYRFRAFISRKDFAAVLPKLLAELDYTNFKDEVWAKQGSERADLYHDVWAVMYRAQDIEHRREGQEALRRGKATR